MKGRQTHLHSIEMRLTEEIYGSMRASSMQQIEIHHRIQVGAAHLVEEADDTFFRPKRMSTLRVHFVL